MLDLREGHDAVSQSYRSIVGDNFYYVLHIPNILHVSRKKDDLNVRPWSVINFEPVSCRVIIWVA